MKPKKNQTNQLKLFQSRLDQIINMNHKLVLLAKQIDWDYLEEKFEKYYTENFGRPGLSTRLMVGLHYLKSMFNEGDESVVDHFLENPYWQYFCGYEYFQTDLPLEPTSLVKWRNRIGSEGAEEMLKTTIKAAKDKKLINKQEMKRVNVDTTVQEKAISFPTDSKLYFKMREILVQDACQRGIDLRQTYKRIAKRALVMQSRYRHSRKFKKANKEVKKLKNYLGRTIRDIRRKSSNIDKALEEKLIFAERLYKQGRTDKNKIYSIWAEEVECISKGKAYKKYEFGNKVSVVSTSRSNWVVGVKSFHGNPYDGHTLVDAISQSERLTALECKEIYCDRSYRGSKKKLKDKIINIVGRVSKKLSRTVRKWFKRRSAIEPIIGHMKNNNRMGRNYLHGKEGDKINALFAGCGFNLRKLLRVFFCLIFWKTFLNRFLAKSARSYKNHLPSPI